MGFRSWWSKWVADMGDRTRFGAVGGQASADDTGFAGGFTYFISRLQKAGNDGDAHYVEGLMEAEKQRRLRIGLYRTNLIVEGITSRPPFRKIYNRSENPATGKLQKSCIDPVTKKKYFYRGLRRRSRVYYDEQGRQLNPRNLQDSRLINHLNNNRVYMGRNNFFYANHVGTQKYDAEGNACWLMLPTVRVDNGYGGLTTEPDLTRSIKQVRWDKAKGILYAKNIGIGGEENDMPEFPASPELTAEFLHGANYQIVKEYTGAFWNIARGLAKVGVEDLNLNIGLLSQEEVVNRAQQGNALVNQQLQTAAFGQRFGEGGPGFGGPGGTGPTGTGPTGPGPTSGGPGGGSSGPTGPWAIPQEAESSEILADLNLAPGSVEHDSAVLATRVHYLHRLREAAADVSRPEPIRAVAKAEAARYSTIYDEATRLLDNDPARAARIVAEVDQYAQDRRDAQRRVVQDTHTRVADFVTRVTR